MFTDFSEERAASIFKIEHCPENGGSTLLLIVRKYLSDSTVSDVRRQ
jgi:hypothetical protein